MVVALQLVVIVVSHSDIIFGGDLYAFGVVWSFAMMGLAVLVLGYTQPEQQRDFRVPLNVRIGVRRITFVPISIAPVRDYNTLYNLASVLARTDPDGRMDRQEVRKRNYWQRLWRHLADIQPRRVPHL